MKKYLLIFFLLILLTNINASENIDLLKDFIDKSNQHGKLIKTIEMEVLIIRSKSGKPPLNIKYSLLYRKKDNHWCGEYERQFPQNNKDTGKWDIKTQKQVHEQIEDINLIFNKEKNCGVIERNPYEGFGGVLLHGLSGIENWSYNLDILNDVKEGKYNIKSINSTHYMKNEAYEVVLESEGVRLRWIFVPNWQYSIAVYEAELTDPEYYTLNKTEIEMKKDPSTGIWFPFNVNIEMKSNDLVVRTETIEYRNVILNKPVDDDQISFKIPKEARLTHAIEKETYALGEPATFEDILSGKVKSIQKMETGEWEKTATTRGLIRFLKMSVALRILIILSVTVVLFYILNMTRKKIYDKKTNA